MTDPVHFALLSKSALRLLTAARLPQSGLFHLQVSLYFHLKSSDFPLILPDHWLPASAQNQAEPVRQQAGLLQHLPDSIHHPAGFWPCRAGFCWRKADSWQIPADFFHQQAALLHLLTGFSHQQALSSHLPAVFFHRQALFLRLLTGIFHLHTRSCRLLNPFHLYPVLLLRQQAFHLPLFSHRPASSGHHLFPTVHPP